MTPDDEDRYTRGLAAMDGDRFAEVFALLLPLAEAGHAESQGIIGSLMQLSLHRFESLLQFESHEAEFIDDATRQADRNEAARWLKEASAGGVGAASFNLAGMYLMGFGGGTWEELKARATELYALAYTQGLTAFGELMNGNGPGQPYLGLLEQEASAGRFPLPGFNDAAAPGDSQ